MPRTGVSNLATFAYTEFMLCIHQPKVDIVWKPANFLFIFPALFTALLTIFHTPYGTLVFSSTLSSPRETVRQS
jgi:hypothetical protein